MNRYLLVLILLCCLPLSAGKSSGYVDSVLVRDSDGLVYFFLRDEVVMSQKPSCATKKYWMVKNENSTAGKNQLSLLMAAQMAGKKVKVYGYNTCERWSDGEDVNTVQLLIK